MEQILTIQEEFDQLISWSEKMFKVQIKADEWTGFINPYIIKLNFEFARFQKENNFLINCYDSLMLCLRCMNGKLDFGESDNVYLDFNHKGNKYGSVLDLLSLEIKDKETGTYGLWYPHKAKGMLEFGWKLDTDERKDFFDAVLKGNGSKIRAKFISTLDSNLKEFGDIVTGEIIEATSVDKQIPNITLSHFLKLLDIIRLYEILYEKNEQKKPLIDNYIDSLPTDEYEKVTRLIDEEYEYFKGIFESYKSTSSANAKKTNELIRQIAENINIEDVNVLGQIISVDRFSIPCIMDFREYCMHNGIRNKAFDWIDSIRENYNVFDINMDIAKNRPAGCLFFFKKNAKPEYGEETQRFIADFKKHFNTK